MMKIFNPENFLPGWEFFLGTNCGSRSFLLNKKKQLCYNLRRIVYIWYNMRIQDFTAWESQSASGCFQYSKGKCCKVDYPMDLCSTALQIPLWYASPCGWPDQTTSIIITLTWFPWKHPKSLSSTLRALKWEARPSSVWIFRSGHLAIRSTVLRHQLSFNGQGRLLKSSSKNSAHRTKKQVGTPSSQAILKMCI